MYTLMLQMPNFPCSGLFWWILPINRALSWDTTLGSQGPAIVAHAPVSQRPEWWEGGKLACWKKSPDEYKNSDTTGSLKKKKKSKLIEMFGNSSLRPQSSVPFVRRRVCSLRLPGAWMWPSSRCFRGLAHSGGRTFPTSLPVVTITLYRRGLSS